MNGARDMGGMHGFGPVVTEVFLDTHAHGQSERAQPVYSVRFTADELWSGSAEPRGRYTSTSESRISSRSEGVEASL